MLTCNVQGRRCVATAILAATVAGGLITAAIAQTPPSPENPAAQIPEKIAPPLNSPGSEGGVNREKFKRDDGVIRPRDDVDPDMTAKPPDSGARMPVIPPPGGPGGDPSIKPK
jgi:hypothetical protein